MHPSAYARLLGAGGGWGSGPPWPLGRAGEVRSALALSLRHKEVEGEPVGGLRGGPVTP
jgi:hypothetical protein